MAPTDEKSTCICTLTADKVLTEDNGVWRCEVTNSHGVTSATCTVKVVDTKTDADDIKVLGLPRFEETIENVIAKEDTDIVFRCKTYAEDEIIDVKWYRNNIPIEGSRPGMERYYTSSEDGVQVLDVRRCRPRDVGIYKCKVYNKMGWTSCDAKLFMADYSDNLEITKYTREHDYSLVESIKSRKALQGYNREFNDADLLINSMCDSEHIKKFLIKWESDMDQTLSFPIHLKNKCSVEGSSAVLSCLMTGKTPVDIRWFKNNIELFDGYKHYMKSLQGVLSLTIPRTELSDTGNYTCVVKNRQGKIYSSCYLQVEPAPYEMTNEVPVKPMFVKPLKRFTTNEGELINFRVAAKGSPAPGFKWFKDGLEIHDSERIKTEVFPNGIAELSIINSTVRDIGLYTCEAHNMAGRAQSMARVSVRDKFEQELWKGRDLDGVTVKSESHSEVDGVIETEATNVRTYTQKVESHVFERIPDFTMRLPTFMPIHSKHRFLLEIRCNGNPKPYVRWYKDGMQLFDETRYHFLSVGDWYGLEVSSAKPRDIGTYTVKIENDAGTIECSCRLEMQLPVSSEVSFQTDMENVEDFSSVVSGEAAVGTDLEGEAFSIAELVPSCHLCNTEADWTTYIEKEVEVIDADEAPSFPHALPEKLTPHENDEQVHIECQVRGEPIPKIVWLKDGKDFEEGPNIKLTMDPKTRIAALIIEKATVSDSGQYSCVAYSESGGHASTVSDIQVLPVGAEDDSVDSGKKTIPEFKVKLSDKEITEGEDVKLECVAEGFPVPKVKWYKNDQPIKPTIGKYTITSSVEGSHSLIIASIHLSDSDCYRCEAVNECGTETSTAHIIVQEPCIVGKDEGEAPSFEGPLHNVTIEEGQTAIIKCVAKGIPTPTLSWLKDGVTLTSGGRVSMVSDDGNGCLTITDTTMDDVGVYICLAENDLGKTESCASIKITEKEKVDVVDAAKSDVESRSSSESKEKLDSQKQTTTKERTDNSFDTANSKVVKSQGSESSITVQDELTTVIETETVQEIDTVNMFTDFTKRPRFVIPPASHWSTVDTPLKIEVEVTKSQDMKVSWYHNDRLITPGDRFKLQIQDGER